MADVPNAELLTEQASGSVGAVTFGRNQHGPWTRPRVVPNDPATPLQVSVRSHLTTCVTAWNATLTQAERDTWDRYALALRQTSPIGRQTNVGGLGMYVRSNVPRLQAAEVSLPRVDVAPALFDLGPFTPVTRVVLNPQLDTFHPFFNESDPWVTESGAALLFYASPAVATSINFWKGPYRYAAPVLGNPAAPPTSPASLPLPFPAAATDRVFIRARLTRADARLTSSFRHPADFVLLPQPVPVLATFTAGAPALIDVQFDQFLIDQPHDNPNWTIRHGNTAWAPQTVTTIRDVIHITANDVGLSFGPDVVSFSPPPFDVRALFTGRPARSFANFPLT